MKKTLIALTVGLLSVAAQAGEIAAEMQDIATNNFITQLSEKFLSENYPNMHLHVYHLASLQRFVRMGQNGTEITYQSVLVMMKKDNSHNGYEMEYLYDSQLQRHTFVNLDQMGDLLYRNDPTAAFNKDRSHLFKGQWGEE